MVERRINDAPAVKSLTASTSRHSFAQEPSPELALPQRPGENVIAVSKTGTATCAYCRNCSESPISRPIKKWAAAVAMAGSVFYDIVTGSRVGTERALIMTLIVLSAVIMNRRALTMRNLAFAVLAVVAIEPEALLGVSFQLSFAAVAALVAVMKLVIAALEVDPDPFVPKRGADDRPSFFDAHLMEKPLALLVATAFATSATASFMAYHFHDLSPDVLIGNPLTLTVIEVFAVPGALLGAVLYPLGLDGPVWIYNVPGVC